MRSGGGGTLAPAEKEGMLYVFDDYSLDTQWYALYYGGVVVHIRLKVFQVLAWLLSHRRLYEAVPWRAGGGRRTASAVPDACALCSLGKGEDLVDRKRKTGQHVFALQRVLARQEVAVRGHLQHRPPRDDRTGRIHKDRQVGLTAVIIVVRHPYPDFNHRTANTGLPGILP